MNGLDPFWWTPDQLGERGPRYRGRRGEADIAGGDILSNGRALLPAKADRRLGLLSDVAWQVSAAQRRQVERRGQLRRRKRMRDDRRSAISASPRRLRGNRLCIGSFSHFDSYPQAN